MKALKFCLMKLLLDENLPVKLNFRFAEASIATYTVWGMQRLGLENGVLLQSMLLQNFTAFLTFDNNLSFQQNFKSYPICVVVLVANDNTYETIMEFFPAVVEKIKAQIRGAQAVVHPAL